MTNLKSNGAYIRSCKEEHVLKSAKVLVNPSNMTGPNIEQAL